jgi:hypothetical protein
MPHRKGLGEAAIDPHAESELGRMLLRGDLGDNGKALELAGATYARMWRNYLITLAGPKAMINGGGSGLTCGGCETTEEKRYCRCTMRKNIFHEAERVVFGAGPGIGTAVQITVCDDRPAERIDLLLAGLVALGEHFGLLTKRKIGGQNRLLTNSRAPAFL